MIAADPRIVSINERRAEVDRLQAQHQERVAAAARRGQERADWAAEAAQAQTLGQPPPDPPPAFEEPVIDEGAFFRFEAMRRELNDEERRVLVEIRPTVEQEAAEAEQALLREAVEYVGCLADVAARLDVLRRLVLRPRQAIDVGDGSERATPGYGLADRTRGPIDVADVVEAVRTGESLLRVAPAPGVSEERPHVDRSRYPMSSPFGTQPKMWTPQSNRPVEI